MIAVKAKNSVAIHRIREVAIATGSKSIIGICDAYLKSTEEAA